MDDVAALRAEAERLRGLARNFGDSKVLAAIMELVNELERRAQDLENGAGA